MPASILFLFLAVAVGVFAHPYNSLKFNHHRSARNLTLDSTELSRRGGGARFTYFDVEGAAGACGKESKNSDFIVALNSQQYGGGYPGPECFKSITISYGGKSTQATIMDECPGCPVRGLDLSPGLFTFFASEDEGVLYGDWHYSDEDRHPNSQTSSEPKPTKHTHTHSRSLNVPTVTLLPIDLPWELRASMTNTSALSLSTADAAFFVVSSASMSQSVKHSTSTSTTSFHYPATTTATAYRTGVNGSQLKNVAKDNGAINMLEQALVGFAHVLTAGVVVKESGL